MDQKIGEHGARLDAVESRLERIEGKLDKVVECLAQQRGGLRTLIAIGGLAGALGALISNLVQALSR